LHHRHLNYFLPFTLTLQRLELRILQNSLAFDGEATCFFGLQASIYGVGLYISRLWSIPRTILNGLRGIVTICRNTRKIFIMRERKFILVSSD
jgi:hypothetical protein